MNKDIITFSLAEEVDKFFSDNEAYRKSLVSGYPSYPGPTSASAVLPNGKVIGACLRSVYFNLLGYDKKPYTPYTLKIFKAGNMFEDLMADQLKSMGLFKAHGVRFYLPDLKIKGELDFVAKDIGYGEYFVENKSFYGYEANKRIFGNKTVKPGPKIENLLQAFLYAYAFREGNQYSFRPLNGGKLFYWSRDKIDVKDFHVHAVEKDDDCFPAVDGVVNKDISFNSIKSRFSKLHECLSTRTVPEKDFDPYPSDEKISNAFKEGEIRKTAFEAFKRKKDDFNRHQCSAFQCRYCDFVDLCVTTDK